MLIGICGLIGNGKGTVADYLVEKHQFEKLSFADSLKDGVSAVFGWDRDMLEGDTDRSRIWREKADEFWTSETGDTVSPRLVLQLFGTDCMRQGFFDGIWVSLVKQKILEIQSKIGYINNNNKTLLIKSFSFLKYLILFCHNILKMSYEHTRDRNKSYQPFMTSANTKK